MEEVVMIQKIVSKDESGIEELIDRYGNLIYGVLNKVLWTEFHRSEIEDVFYDIVMKLWNNLDCYDPKKGKLTSFIISVSKFTAIDYLRKNKKLEEFVELNNEILGESESIKDEYDIIDKKEEFIDLLQGLKDIDKDIFIRKYYLLEDMTKIAKDLGVTEDYVYNRLSRGRKKLKDKLKGVVLNG